MSEEVGSLTRVLSNVKTTGIFGEIQLGAIIEQILSPEQYAKNVVTNKATKDPVEFVIRLPGTNNEGEVLLPIDSKFPYTMYNEMQNAFEQNNMAEFESRRKGLISTIKNMAKDISTKYICPPNTTNFAIMFLPIEGLYAEVVKQGLVETLQKDYNITVAGPTTMSALLNSLQMGFQTLAVQKKSADVWNVLENVKMEFKNYNVYVDKIQKNFERVSKDFDNLVGRRTRAIERTLREVNDIEAFDSTPTLDYDADDVISF
jgi:DNA recombination protein RmuC